MEDLNRVMDWDSTIEADGFEKTVLPAGEYPFKVANLERGSFPGSEKLSACKKATLTLEVFTGHGTETIRDDILLHYKLEWKLSQFFRAIGQKKKGEKITMDWGHVVGSTGWALIGVQKYIGKDGTEHERNKVETYLDYDTYMSRIKEGENFFDRANRFSNPIKDR